MTTLQEQNFDKYSAFDTTKGVYYLQNERVEELNDRIQERRFPDKPLEPIYDLRPIATKYTMFPMNDVRKQAKEPKQIYPEYDATTNFIPSNNTHSKYDVDVENMLGNYAKEKNKYVPASSSDLYNVTIPSRPSVQPFEGLFRKNEFPATTHPNNQNTQIGKDRFYNHTRTQLRSIV